ncbi:MAG: hypothetical protein ABR925_01510 [Acidimicrobiales bacterium]
MIAKMLRDQFPDVEVVRGDDPDVDVVAVVCGCPVGCASHAHLQGKLGKIVIRQEADYEELRRLLLSFSAMEEEADGLEG